MSSAKSVDSRATPSDSRAPVSTRDSTSRPSASLPSRNHGLAGRERRAPRAVFLVAPLDRIDEPQRVAERRVERSPGVNEMRAHRRRVRIARELAPGIVRCDPRRHDDEHRERDEYRFAGRQA